MLYYVDTSALVKRYRTEPGSDVVHELFEGRRPDDALVTSYLTAVEVEAVAARAFRGRLLSRRAYQTLLGRFAQDLNTILDLEEVSNATLLRAISFARRYGLLAPDAIHLATVSMLDDPLVVAGDQELVDVAQQEGRTVLDPEQPAALQALRGYRTNP